MEGNCGEFTRIPFITVLRGALSLSQVSVRDGLTILQQSGCTCLVVFLTNTSKYPYELESYCKMLNIMIFPVISNEITKKSLGGKKKLWFLIECLYRARNILQTGGRILVYYKSRIAKSGIFTYALLRISGHSPGSSRQNIEEIVQSKKKYKKISFEIAELLTLKVLHDKLFPIQEFRDMEICKTIENPLIFVKLTLNHKLLLRIDCIVTDQKLKVFALGPTFHILFNSFIMKQTLGDDWLVGRNISDVIGGLPVSVVDLENQIVDFFQACFGNNKAIWAGPLIHLDLIFFKLYCPNLIRTFGEEMIRTDENAKESIVHEIIAYKQRNIL